MQLTTPIPNITSPLGLPNREESCTLRAWQGTVSVPVWDALPAVPAAQNWDLLHLRKLPDAILRRRHAQRRGIAKVVIDRG